MPRLAQLPFWLPAFFLLLAAAAPSIAEAQCRDVISVHHPRPHAVSCCGCGTKLVQLEVYDPVCCECVPIVVCVPDCGCDYICKTERGGLVARSVTWFHFSSGYRVKVVVGPRGNLVVHTFG